MPKRTDIKSILVIGSGPIIIGQGCEFDYAGTKACLALKKQGYRVILINSNPATIMTDPDIADVTYIEPITEEIITQIIKKEQANALLPTVGGQIALNIGLQLAKKGVLSRYGVELIGANEHAIETAENRQLFNQKMREVGVKIPESQIATNVQEALHAADKLGYPIIIRSSFALGGTGSGIVNNRNELISLCQEISATNKSSIFMLNQALIGWKEYELEVMRDTANNCIVVCGIENINPLGVHTGDSITVSPIMTLTDKEYQQMRNTAFAVMQAVGVETGGANIQFAVHPQTGEMLVIEMNPRVSRSSALASKSTGYPIASVAALLAVGFTLNEIKSDILSGKIPASFEPVIDYVAIKMPRFQFEKFPTAKDILGTQMQALGEVMGIGRTFQEALQKAIRSLDINCHGLETIYGDKGEIINSLINPNSNQLWAIADAFRAGLSLDMIHKLTYIDPWFLCQIKELIDLECIISNNGVKDLSRENLYHYKRKGFSDYRIAALMQCGENEIQTLRIQQNINPVYKRIDSCAGEFITDTAYLYSCYEDECEAKPTFNKKIIVIGSGPNRIGQGIEFDYCCVQAIKSLRELGYEAIVINSNPDTVSTDYSCADRLYFSALTAEDISAILEIEKPSGVLLQFGGQTPLNLAKQLAQFSSQILGFTAEQIDITENRQQFNQFLEEREIPHPHNKYVYPEQTNNLEELIQEINFPLLIRPSYIIGGSQIQIIDSMSQLMKVMAEANCPLFIEEYLQNAIEVEIDMVCDGDDVFIPAIMENWEPAGVHSGDSTCCIPPMRLNLKTQQQLLDYARTIALQLRAIGLINIQFAVQNEKIYVLEVNLRASRTVPFVSKACGVNLVKAAVECIMGKSLKVQRLKRINREYFAIKRPIFPYDRFANIVLGPEMKSTGEIMSVAFTFSEAYQKVQLANGQQPDYSKKVFSIRSLQQLHESREVCTAF